MLGRTGVTTGDAFLPPFLFSICISNSRSCGLKNGAQSKVQAKKPESSLTKGDERE